MFSNLENAIIFAAAIWGCVKVVEHFFPSYWDKMESERRRTTGELHARVDAIEAKLNTEAK